MDPVVGVGQDKRAGQHKGNHVLSAAGLFHRVGQHRQGKHHGGNGACIMFRPSVLMPQGSFSFRTNVVIYTKQIDHTSVNNG